LYKADLIIISLKINSPKCCVLNGEATNTHLIVFGFTRTGFEPTIYGTRGEHGNHYTTDAVKEELDRTYKI
jgi:hypothetical protein